jgi:hypothetical protein
MSNSALAPVVVAENFDAPFPRRDRGELFDEVFDSVFAHVFCDFNRSKHSRHSGAIRFLKVGRSTVNQNSSTDHFLATPHQQHRKK